MSKINLNAELILKTLFYIGLLNFALFLLFTSILGGDALNGYIKDGVFYVGSHGNYTQVSENTWRISKIHGQSAYISMIIGVFSYLYLTLIKAGKPKNL